MDSWWRVVPELRAECTAWWESVYRKPAGKGKSAFKTASSLWVYMKEWRTENAAGDGMERGKTGRLRFGEWGWWREGGSCGRSAQWKARTSECTGNTMVWSAEDLEDETARTCVG